MTSFGSTDTDGSTIKHLLKILINHPRLTIRWHWAIILLI